MAQSQKKQVAIITGASSGLGELFASEFSQFAAKLSPKIEEIWIIARRKDKLLSLQSRISPFPCRVFSGDLTDASFLSLIEEEFQSVSICWLVNNAGFGLVGTFSNLDRLQQLKMIQLNCTALVDLTARALPYMQKGSRIVMVASSAGFFPLPQFAVYAATKAFVVSFSHALASELIEKDIAVTTVCPGPIETEFFDHASPTGVKPKVKMAKPLDVVRLAINDAQKGSLTSTYGILYKLAILLSGLTPRWILKTKFRVLFKKSLNP